MKKKLVVPKFKSEKEEAEFWTSLNLSEYFDLPDFKKGVQFPFLKRSKRLISIRFPEELIGKVKEKANELDVPYQSLIRQYVKQGVSR
ncbi:MAG: BrnA antitoxin family protein [Candidatus Levybacteria bacterium]|nr:BrnA antitoxin family protein [Candidatus Levybacteria bacterium]